MLVGGGLLFFVAGLAAVAALIAMKASAGVSGFWIELGVPLANSLLDAAGVNLKAPEQHGASGLIVATFILSFVVAASSLTSMGFGSVWLLVRLARDRRVSDRGRDIADVADTAVDAGRRHAVAALDRGSQEYAELKPKISRAARRGRETFNDDVQPRVAAGVAKAATHGRVLIARRRAWAEQRSRRR